MGEQEKMESGFYTFLSSDNSSLFFVILNSANHKEHIKNKMYDAPTVYLKETKYMMCLRANSVIWLLSMFTQYIILSFSTLKHYEGLMMSLYLVVKSSIIRL